MLSPMEIPLSNDLLSIARLYLEKYDVLADEDKKLYRNLILPLANPPMVVKDECIPQSILESREIEAHNTRCAEFLKDERARRDQAAGMAGHLGVTRHVCPECARHGHEGIPATRDRHSDYPGDGNCSVCGGYCDQSS